MARPPAKEKGLSAADINMSGSFDAIDFGHMRKFLLGMGTIPPQ